MPRRPGIGIVELASLAEQRCVGPREVAVRDVERAEGLVRELEDGASYPWEWVAWRVTGYRPEGVGPVLSAEAWRRGLGAYVAWVSGAVGMRVEECPAGSVGVEEVCRRWGVSVATVTRLRGEGLVARRVVGGRGGVLVFTPAAIEWCEGRMGARLGKARGFSRIEAKVRREMVRRARGYARRLGWSLQKSARRLAERFGRSEEGVRQVLRRGAPELVPTAVMDAKRRGVLLRATRLGMGVATLARRVEKTPGAVRRALLVARAERLAAWVEGLPGVGAGVGASVGAGVKGLEVLEHPAARTGLGGAWPGDVVELVRGARGRSVHAAPELARARAAWVLGGEVRRVVAGLDVVNPSAAGVDEGETMLRWIARLRAAMLWEVMGVVVRGLEARLGCAVEEVPTNRPDVVVPTLVRGAMVAAARAIAGFDPTAGGRAAGAVGLAVDRVGAAWVRRLGMGEGADGGRAGRAVGAGGARSRLVGGARIEDARWLVARWCEGLDPWVLRRAGEAGLSGWEVEFVQRRFGMVLGGMADGAGVGPPERMMVVAASLGMTPARGWRVEGEVVRKLRKTQMFKAENGQMVK